MKKVNLPDWAIRALKTFVQALLGVLITAIIVLLQNGFPDSLSAAWIVVSPVVAAGLASAISAAWNVILEHMKGADVNDNRDDEGMTEE